MTATTYRTQAAILHIYLDQSLKRLNDILEDEKLWISNRPWTIETVGSLHKNYWLIQLPNGIAVDEPRMMFQNTHLRFDTMAFSFIVKGIQS